MKISYLFSKLIKKIHLPAIKNSNIDKTSKICSGAHIVETLLDRYSYVGNYCTVINSEIGKFCSIADNCIIGGARHPINWVSTSPVFHKGKNILRKNFSRHEFEATARTFIGNDVWIGNNCLIKSGVTIGNGAVIGMGSVVTKNVGSYEIWAGNPAKLIRMRFDLDTIKILNELQWWDFDDTKIFKLAKDFPDVKNFIDRSISSD